VGGVEEYCDLNNAYYGKQLKRHRKTDRENQWQQQWLRLRREALH
jgi:hypothetical protein